MEEPGPSAAKPAAALLHRTAVAAADERIVYEHWNVGDIPVLVGRPADQTGHYAAFLLLHSTGNCKACAAVAELMARHAHKRVVVSFDLTYHGGRSAVRPTEAEKAQADELLARGTTPEDEAWDRVRSASRASALESYHSALIAAYRGDISEQPFVLDSASDAISVTDFVFNRSDVDCSVGLTTLGISLGGMVALVHAARDRRVRSAVPIIGAQGFQWALDRGEWAGRVDSIRPLFDAAADGNKLDTATVEGVWRKIAPQLLSEFDLGAVLARVRPPRAILMLNGGDDPRCPVAGVKDEITKAYKLVATEEYPGFAGTSMPLLHDLQVFEGVGHEVTEAMWSAAEAFLQRRWKESHEQNALRSGKH